MMPLKKAKDPFRFMTQMSLTEITTRRARNLMELLEHLKEAPDSVIYHHTHRFLVQHQYLSPEPPNDFAYWVSAALQEEVLAEKLSAIDTVRFATIGDLRMKIVKTIEEYLARSPGPVRDASPGEDFAFMRSLSFVLPTSYEARDLEEFSRALKKISVYSLYHHMFEARLRLSSGVNDFSRWLTEALGEAELGKSIARLDPYTQTLEGLRKKLVHLVDQAGGTVRA